MADFDDAELIRGSESPDQAALKFLRGGYSRLVHTTSEQSAKLGSVEAKLLKVKNTLSQLANQLGIHPIDAESSQQVPPVTSVSDLYVRDDVNRLPLDNRKSLSHQIEMPEFDGSNVYDWLSKVERFFSVRRYSDLDKLDLVAFSLEGDVLKWFNWEMTRREFNSWEEFRRRLFSRFGAAPEESPGNRLFAIKQQDTVSAYVTESEELSSQIVGLEDSHLEQVFNEKTEMQEVFKLKEPVRLENQKKSRCLKVLMFSDLSQASQVWEPGGVLASVNVAASLGETASYTEKQLILQSREMDSTNGTGVDVESANGANGVNGGGDIVALPPLPPILPPNVVPLHVKTEPVEIAVADLQGHFYHYSVALFYDDGCFVEAEGIGRKILDKVPEPYHSDLDGKEFAYAGEKMLFTYGVLPDNKMDFAVVLEEVFAVRINGNAIPNDNENDGDRNRLHRWHKWKSKRLHPNSAWAVYLSSVISTVTSATSSSLLSLHVYQMRVSVIQDIDKEMVADSMLTVLEVTFVRGIRVHGVSGLRLFLDQQKFSSIWHRWRRKDSDLEVQLQERALVQSSVSSKMIPSEVGSRELLVQWQLNDLSGNSWMFSLPSLRTSLFSGKGVLISFRTRQRVCRLGVESLNKY